MILQSLMKYSDIYAKIYLTYRKVWLKVKNMLMLMQKKYFI